MKKYNDKKFINAETFLSYCNTNEEVLTQPVKAVLVEFPGLDGSSCIGGTRQMQSYNYEPGITFGKDGILMAFMFPGPWSWGNRGAVRMADAVVDAIFEKYNLPADTPVGVCGGSMGSVGAMMFAIGSRYKVSVVAAACPNVNPLDTLCAHPEFPRAYISAVASYDAELEDGLKEIALIHRIPDLPKTTYFICSDAEDEVFPEEECDKFVAKMKEAGYDVEYHKQPGKKHGGFLEDVRERMHTVIKTALLGM